MASASETPDCMRTRRTSRKPGMGEQKQCNAKRCRRHRSSRPPRNFNQSLFRWLQHDSLHHVFNLPLSAATNFPRALHRGRSITQASEPGPPSQAWLHSNISMERSRKLTAPLDVRRERCDRKSFQSCWSGAVCRSFMRVGLCLGDKRPVVHV